MPEQVFMLCLASNHVLMLPEKMNLQDDKIYCGIPDAIQSLLFLLKTISRLPGNCCMYWEHPYDKSYTVAIYSRKQRKYELTTHSCHWHKFLEYVKHLLFKLATGCPPYHNMLGQDLKHIGVSFASFHERALRLLEEVRFHWREHLANIKYNQLSQENKILHDKMHQVVSDIFVALSIQNLLPEKPQVQENNLRCTREAINHVVGQKFSKNKEAYKLSCYYRPAFLLDSKKVNEVTKKPNVSATLLLSLEQVLAAHNASWKEKLLKAKEDSSSATKEELDVESLVELGSFSDKEAEKILLQNKEHSCEGAGYGGTFAAARIDEEPTADYELKRASTTSWLDRKRSSKEENKRVGK